MNTSLLPTFPGEVFVETAEFDQGIRQLLPYYDQMLDAIAHCLPSTATQILELGCGTGELSQRLLQQCPQAQLIALDYSPRMLDYARRKLHSLGLEQRVTWIEADFGDWALGKVTLPICQLTACVSSLAIHHLSDAMKVQLLQQIYQRLESGGCFWNADPILPESEAMAVVYQSVREAWTAAQGTDLAAVRSKIGSRDSYGHSSRDQLATLNAHLQMLQTAGFQAIEVPWKYYGLAVFGGFKDGVS